MNFPIGFDDMEMMTEEELSAKIDKEDADEDRQVEQYLDESRGLYDKE